MSYSSQSQAKAITSFSPVKLTFYACLLAIIIYTVSAPPRERPTYQLDQLKLVAIPDVDSRAIIQSLKLATAYQMTHVKFHAFDRHKTRMPGEESYYLEQMFDLVNIGIIERVQWFSVRDHEALNYARISDNHDQIMFRMNRLHVPARLEKVHYLILNAVKEEHDYFKQWKTDPNKRFHYKDPLVQSSNDKLLAAYRILTDTYKEEDETTRKSFYSHLCALSFI
ncbi:MAG: hypothetical protein MRY32_09635 [Rickettsiales bacterium]|nr:hypothetical protein [Rickettsiales bacterium]